MQRPMCGNSLLQSSFQHPPQTPYLWSLFSPGGPEERQFQGRCWPGAPTRGPVGGSTPGTGWVCGDSPWERARFGDLCPLSVWWDTAVLAVVAVTAGVRPSGRSVNYWGAGAGKRPPPGRGRLASPRRRREAAPPNMAAPAEPASVRRPPGPPPPARRRR